MSYQASAYTSSIGIEKDDVVNLDYVLTVDGKIKEEGPGTDITVTTGQGGVIQGFYEGLLGMKVNEEKKIVVPPSKGYSTGELAGKTLYFDVLINYIVSNVRGEDYTDGAEGGVGTTLKKIGNVIVGIGILAAVYFIYSIFKNRITVPNCGHCA